MLNRADFQWNVHYPAYLKAGGTDGKAQALRVAEAGDDFSGLEKALIALTDQSTLGVQVERRVTETLKALLGETGTVEAVATVAVYNMVSRFLVALAIA